MSEFAKEITQVNIEKELKQSYLAYAMSVIVGRALPDVRDGLKPVHRRVLYAMNVLGNEYNKPYKKSARIVGDVIGKYHPHGDSAVYDTIVRMAQPFSLRYLLIDGQGNFGSVDGDSPAAMRYTEIRMSKMAHFLLEDLEKETVDFLPNYDESEFAPAVLPARVPNLLINGSSGIAVGMATNIPPHNLNEVIDGCLAVIDQPDIDLLELMKLVPGPDFPTAGILNGRSGIVQAYKTGRGRIILRGRSHIEGKEGEKQSIIISELPYQVNKARMIEKIADLVKNKRMEGITELRDESDRDGMRVVIELRRNENTDVIMNNLYKQTQLQTVFGINMVAIDNGEPKLMNLMDILKAFITHRREVVTRRCIFELRKARDRAHLLEGQGIALANIDEVVTLIKNSASPAVAKEKLLERSWQLGDIAPMLEASGRDVSRPDNLPAVYGVIDGNYKLSPDQAQAILDLRLHRLTGLEKDKIINEYKALIDKINELLAILGDPDKLMQVIKDEFEEVKKQFGDDRRTEIIDSEEILCDEDLIPEECVVVTVSGEGYAKTQAIDTYQSQHRGGRGKTATKMKDEDQISHLIVASSHDTLLCFSNLGKVYWLKTYQIPQASRTAKGRPLVNILPFSKEETLSAILPVKEFNEDQFVFMATEKGTVKKVALTEFSRPRNGGIKALDIREGDNLVRVALTDGQKEVMLFSDGGKVTRFAENEVRAMGRTASGVRGIRLKEGQKLIGLIIVGQEGTVLVATEKGNGKRTEVSEFRRSGRGGQGVIAIQVNERNGNVIGASLVEEEHDILLISDGGTLVRIPVNEISLQGRNTQGVRLIKLSAGEKLVGLRRIDEIDKIDHADETVDTDESDASDIDVDTGE